MYQEPNRPEQEDIRDLLDLYEDLRTGRGGGFLSEESFERIIDHYDEADQIPSALEAAESAIAQYPYSCSLLVKKADLLIATRRYNESLELLRHAQILDSTDIDIYILKTDAYLALDMQEKAVELLEEAIGRFDGEDRLNLLFELADVYDDYEEFDKIFDCLRLILEQEPTNEEALYKICFWTDFTGRNEESIRLHQTIIDEYPYNELAWFNLAAAYQGLKLYEKSVDAYKYAIVINEKFDYAYRNMADAYIRMRKYRDAIEALEKVVELARPEDVIYEAIGHCYERLKNHAQARFYYRKASHLNPEESKLHYKVAGTYMQEQNWTQAIKNLEQALKIHRNQSEYHQAMGECQLQMGRHREAIHHFTMVVQQRPRKIAGWEALLRCLYRSEDFNEADVQARLAYEASGQKTIFLYYRVAILQALGKSKEALLVLESAMGRDPRGLRKLINLDPAILQHPQLVDLVARYKRNRSI
jgi:tetratricopeptide (TPR) repeat protein